MNFPAAAELAIQTAVPAPSARERVARVRTEEEVAIVEGEVTTRYRCQALANQELA